MNKNEIRERINQLPKFEKRKVFVKDRPENGAEDEYKLHEQDQHRAICEVGKHKSYAYVNSHRYKLWQFSDIFLPMLDSVDDEVEGYVVHYGGYASMTLFPTSASMQTDNGRFGIVCVNSVDCSSAVLVKFCVRSGPMTVTIPRSVAGLKKHHSKGTKIAVQDYVSMIGPVKSAWENIITKFPKFKVVGVESEEGNELEFSQVVEHFGLGKNLTKKLRERYDASTAEGESYSLWDLFADAVEVVTDRKFKSDVHKNRRLEKLSEAVFKFNTLIELSED